MAFIPQIIGLPKHHSTKLTPIALGSRIPQCAMQKVYSTPEHQKLIDKQRLTTLMNIDQTSWINVLHFWEQLFNSVLVNFNKIIRTFSN